jgi:hypothetical protein
MRQVLNSSRRPCLPRMAWGALPLTLLVLLSCAPVHPPKAVPSPENASGGVCDGRAVITHDLFATAVRLQARR